MLRRKCRNNKSKIEEAQNQCEKQGLIIENLTGLNYTLLLNTKKSKSLCLPYKVKYKSKHIQKVNN